MLYYYIRNYIISSTLLWSVSSISSIHSSLSLNLLPPSPSYTLLSLTHTVSHPHSSLSYTLLSLSLSPTLLSLSLPHTPLSLSLPPPGGLAIVETVLWDAVPSYLRKLNAQCVESLGQAIPLTLVPIQFSSWMGGTYVLWFCLNWLDWIGFDMACFDA